MKQIPYAKQHINEDDIKSVVNILESDWLTQGPALDRFEQAVANYCGSEFAVAVNSATSALHLACMAAELGKGEELWTSPNSFVASANCGLYCGAGVDFVDIDEKTYNMSPAAFSAKISASKKKGIVPKVVIPVHFAGQPCEMQSFWNETRNGSTVLIEDASHAIGARYLKHRIGSCKFSDMTVFSFHPVKIITTGEGGVITTNNPNLYERLLQLRSHGITRNPAKFINQPDGPWYYEQQALGWNFRMTDIQAALGTSQLKRIDEFVARRRYLAMRYAKLLKELPVKLPWQHPDTLSAYHLYVIRLNSEQVKKSHREVFEELQRRGIRVNLHYIPIYTQPYYQRLGFCTGLCPAAEKYYQEAVSLPMFYGLTAADQDYVVSALEQVLA